MDSSLMKKVLLVKEVISLPVVEIKLNGCEEVYNQFTARHPRCPLFKKKTIGVALISLMQEQEQYLKSINGKNSAAYYARKASRRGYTFTEINPNDYLDDIYEINTSKQYRQGRIMAEQYTKRITMITLLPFCKYYGIISPQGKLVAYAWVPIYGQLAIITTILGHAAHLNEGVVYQLVVNIVLEMVRIPASVRPPYLMYDTYFGASEGLKMFKKKCGFKPYRVRWRL